MNWALCSNSVVIHGKLPVLHKVPFIDRLYLVPELYNCKLRNNVTLSYELQLMQYSSS